METCADRKREPARVAGRRPVAATREGAASAKMGGVALCAYPCLVLFAICAAQELHLEGNSITAIEGTPCPEPLSSLVMLDLKDQEGMGLTELPARAFANLTGLLETTQYCNGDGHQCKAFIDLSKNCIAQIDVEV